MAMFFSSLFPPRLPISLWSPPEPSSSSASSAAARGITGSPAYLLTVASASGASDFLQRGCRQHLRLIASLLGAYQSSHFHGEGNILSGAPWRELAVGSLFGDLRKAQTSFMYFFSGQGLGNGETQRRLRLENENPKGSSGDVRWTNVLLALNVAAYLAQLATRGKLLLWGAKVNSLIDQGQFWRLATSSFLHANIVHLMVNCYSLNNVGPTMEKLLGTQRFFAVYLASAVAGSAMSYLFSQSPAVGASGAIFGLVGSSALFFIRHKNLIKSGAQEAKEIMRIVALNIVTQLPDTYVVCLRFVQLDSSQLLTFTDYRAFYTRD